MAQFHQRPQLHQVTPVVTPPEPQRRRRVRESFRWEYLIIPLFLLGVMWILSGVDGTAFRFGDVMDRLHVRNREQYRQLATMGTIAVAIVWLVRVCRTSKE